MSEPGKNFDIAFLFNAEDPAFEGFYGEPCDHALLRALFKIDTSNICTSQLRRGDIFIYNLCKQIKSVSKRKKSTTNESGSITIGVDKDLYAAIFWDFIDTISIAWHTTSDEDLPLSLMSQRTYIVYFPTMSMELARKIDYEMRGFSAYQGAIQLDSGNPVHMQIFRGTLLNDAFIKDGKVHTSVNFEGYRTNFLCSEDSHLEERLVVFPEDDFHALLPPMQAASKFSDRGLITSQVISDNKKDSHYQNLAQKLSNSTIGDLGDRDFEFLVPEGFEKIIVQKEKLAGYSLNENHATGSAKARLFKEALGIESRDWEYLQSQIIKYLPSVEIHKTRITEYGIQYHAVIPILGKNGQTRDVVTGWVVENESYARLTTAYIQDRKSS